MGSEDRVKTTFVLPRRLHVYLRTEAAARGTNMSTYTEGLLVQAIAMGNQGQERRKERVRVEVDKEAKEYRLERSGSPDLVFVGRRVAHGATQGDRGLADYSGDVGRYQEVDCYQTEGGKYILHVGHYSNWQGEQDRLEAIITDEAGLAGVMEAAHLHVIVRDDLYDMLDITERAD